MMKVMGLRWLCFVALSALPPNEALAAEQTSSIDKSSALTTPTDASETRRLTAIQSPAPSPATNPDLSAWRADGPAGRVRQRGAITHITPLRGNAPSVALGGANARWCGVRLQTGGASPQSLVLVGMGVTEALSCDGIKAFGAVPAPNGVERIAFLYGGSSPNASGVSTIVIVQRTSQPASVGWVVNDDLSYKLDQLGTLTSIPAIRAHLARNSQR